MQILLHMLSKFEWIDFKFAWYYKQNLETIHYSSFADLNKFKVSLLQELATEIESIDFVGYYTSTLFPSVWM